ncbi:MAG TPA: hypothetical protein VFE94_03010 [Candidatus Paceibacterota bacterium]|nr:hypothetical protein [Candidatus Paceibacterota bacterium]
MAGLQTLVGSSVAIIRRIEGEIADAYIATLQGVDENRNVSATNVFDQKTEKSLISGTFYLGFDPPFSTIEIMRLHPPHPRAWWPRRKGAGYHF